MNERIIFSIAGIVLASIACQWFAWRAKLPSILFLLMAGILAGPATGLLRPDALFGNFLFPMISLSVAVILFEGSLTLKLREIKGLERVVRNLLTLGILVTFMITACAARLALKWSWELSALFGAITVVTGPTVIVPLLRAVQPKASIANILRWEGIMIDPLGAVFSVLVFEFIISEPVDFTVAPMVLDFGKMAAAGLLSGGAAGYIFGLALRNYVVPEFLHNLAALAAVFGLFAGSNAVHPESGLLAVTAMGFCLANMKDVHIDEIVNFKESLSILLVSVLFIILAARIEFSQFVELWWPGLWVFLAMQFISRPVNAAISTAGSSLSWRERALLCWIAPRGIVAASIAALFALRLERRGFENANLLVPMTFLVIMGTVILQGATSRTLAKWLGVAEPEPNGFLIIGANAVGRAIAKALQEIKHGVLLADTNWENIKKARMEGLPTFYGNPLSEHANLHLDLVGLGGMLAVSPNGHLNVLASLYFRKAFGRTRVFALQAEQERKSVSGKKMPTLKEGALFGEDATYAALAEIIYHGGKVRGSSLTDNFSMEDYSRQYDSKAIPLFALDPKGKLSVFVSGEKINCGPGWTIVSLTPKDAMKRE
ncbi:MAG: sodium:proton antiporter [Nitrospinae bacterium]|nr:sodium:proton antiporter [Nitrospinota bacterium]